MHWTVGNRRGWGQPLDNRLQGSVSCCSSHVVSCVPAAICCFSPPHPNLCCIAPLMGVRVQVIPAMSCWDCFQLWLQATRLWMLKCGHVCLQCRWKVRRFFPPQHRGRLFRRLPLPTSRWNCSCTSGSEHNTECVRCIQYIHGVKLNLPCLHYEKTFVTTKFLITNICHSGTLPSLIKTIHSNKCCAAWHWWLHSKMPLGCDRQRAISHQAAQCRNTLRTSEWGQSAALNSSAVSAALQLQRSCEQCQLCPTGTYFLLLSILIKLSIFSVGLSVSKVLKIMPRTVR